MNAKSALALSLATITLLFTASLPVQSEVLKGSVQAYEEVVQTKLKELRPKWDEQGLKETCSCINPNKVRAVQENGMWKLVDDGDVFADFGTRQDAAEAAVNLIKFYKFTDSCWAGRSQGSDLHEMRYFKTNDGVPSGAMPGEDAITIDPDQVKAEEINGTWKVTSGDIWCLDYGQDRQACEQAADVIKTYRFTKHCFVGKPARAMMYFRR